MNIVALLAFYDEHPATLTRMIASLPRAGVSTLVALDGAYALYPDAQAASPADQRAALMTAALNAGVTLELHTPDEPWPGNEVQKRTRLFELGEQHTQPEDWYLVIDADEHIIDAPDDLHTRLSYSVFDVGEITLHGLHPPKPFPMIFRAIPGLHCHRNHYTYRTPDHRFLWGNAKTTRLQAREPLRDMHVVHDQHRPRDRRRRHLQDAYYGNRDSASVETDYVLALP